MPYFLIHFGSASRDLMVFERRLPLPQMVSGCPMRQPFAMRSCMASSDSIDIYLWEALQCGVRSGAIHDLNQSLLGYRVVQVQQFNVNALLHPDARPVLQAFRVFPEVMTGSGPYLLVLAVIVRRISQVISQ